MVDLVNSFICYCDSWICCSFIRWFVTHLFL